MYHHEINKKITNAFIDVNAESILFMNQNSKTEFKFLPVPAISFNLLKKTQELLAYLYFDGSYVVVKKLCASVFHWGSDFISIKASLSLKAKNQSNSKKEPGVREVDRICGVT